jgi:hypothetical protein
LHLLKLTKVWKSWRFPSANRSCSSGPQVEIWNLLSMAGWRRWIQYRQHHRQTM